MAEAAAVFSDAGNGNRDRKSELPFAQPMRYSIIEYSGKL